MTGKHIASHREHVVYFGTHILSDLQAIAWSPDSTRIASMESSQKNQIWVWDAATGKTITTYQGYVNDKSRIGKQNAQPEALVWSPLGTRIASIATWSDKAVRIWNATTGKELSSYRSPYGINPTLAWSYYDSYLAATLDKKVCVWDVTQGFKLGRKTITYDGHAAVVRKLVWSPASSLARGQYIASVDDDHTIHVWNTTTGKNITTYRGHCKEQRPGSYPATEIAWSPDGQYVASSMRNGPGFHNIHLWDAASGNLVAIYVGHYWAWIPNGLWVAFVSNGTSVTIGQPPGFTRHGHLMAYG